MSPTEDEAYKAEGTSPDRETSDEEVEEDGENEGGEEDEEDEEDGEDEEDEEDDGWCLMDLKCWRFRVCAAERRTESSLTREI